MFKLSEKLGKLNFEQKLLLLATLFVPTLIFVVFLNLAFNEIYILLFPPDPRINFSSGSAIKSFYFSGIGILSLVTLLTSAIVVLYRKLVISLVFLTITLLLILTRIFQVGQNIFYNYLEPSPELIFYSFIEDIIFFGIVSFLFIWQISIYLRIRNQSFGENNRLK
jgi:hypothetical protein